VRVGIVVAMGLYGVYSQKEKSVYRWMREMAFWNGWTAQQMRRTQLSSFPRENRERRTRQRRVYVGQAELRSVYCECETDERCAGDRTVSTTTCDSGGWP